jgi:hypothetical protein
VTIEAKDNDPLTGPKWGSSGAITILPPDVGEPEALRLAALRGLRDALVDTLAFRLETPEAKTEADRLAAAAESLKRQGDDDRRAADAVASVNGGVRVPNRLRALLVARAEATSQAVAAEARAPSAARHAATLKATERFVLVTDAVIQGLALRDARGAAKELADVADDLVRGLGQMQNEASDERALGLGRSAGATAVLDAGGRVMTSFGELGRDLGEIVAVDVARVKRATDAADLPHAELAARDLAARLRQPDPSFGSRGQSGPAGKEAGEAGGGQGDDDDQGSADDVAQAFGEAAQELERLAQDHATGMAKTEQALAGAASEEDARPLRDEARRHVEAIREAARTLPAVGEGSDSWTSKGSAARELAEQMARSLEEGRPEEAVQTGRSALGTLDEAKKILQRASRREDVGGEKQRRVEDVQRRLDAEAKWAEEAARELRRRTAERARDSLQQSGQAEERMADRARDLGERGRERASFPQQAVEAIEEAARAAREAARALSEGETDRGLEREREAQRRLEAAREQLQDDQEGEDAERGGDGNDRSPGHDSVAIPNANEHKGPEEFRRRVMRGLGLRSSGALKDAVRRYAEGLLR